MAESYLEFWRLNTYPRFDVHPLNFKEKVDWEYFVKTRSKSLIDEHIPKFKSGSLRSYLFTGARGMGKTTLMNYLYYRLISEIEKENHFCIFYKFPKYFLRDSNTADEIIDVTFTYMVKAIHKSLRTPYNMYKESMGDLIQRFESHYRNNFDRDLRKNVELIDDAFDTISSFYNRTFLFIDEYDKIEEDRLTHKILSDLQAFFEEYIWNKNAVVFWSGHHGWAKFIKDISGIFDKEIPLRKWTLEEICELIGNRLKPISTLSQFAIDYYFENAALKYIYEENNAHPRYVLECCDKLFYHAYENKTRPINYHFCIRMPHAIHSGHEAEERTFENIYDNMLKRYSKAYTILRNMFAQDYDLNPKIIDIIASHDKGYLPDAVDEKIINILEKNEAINILRSDTGKRVIRLTSSLLDFMTYLDSKLYNRQQVNGFLYEHFGI